MTVDVYRVSSVVLRIKPTSGNFSDSLSGAKNITINFTLSTAFNFALKDYITYDGEDYYLNSLPTAKKESTHQFNYTIVFESIMYDLAKAQFLFKNLSDFYFNGTAADFVALIIENVDRVHGDNHIAVGEVDADKYLNMQFNGEDCLNVLNRIAKEFELEFYFTDNTINLIHEVGTSSGKTFKYGRGKGLYSLVRQNVDSKKLITRLYGFGSEKNILHSYRVQGGTAKNLLKIPNATDLIDAVDIDSRSTKTYVPYGWWKWVNNGTGISRIRCLCNESDLVDNNPYTGSIVFLNPALDTVKINWCGGTPTQTTDGLGRINANHSRVYDSTFRYFEIEIESGATIFLHMAQVEAGTVMTAYDGAYSQTSGRYSKRLVFDADPGSAFQPYKESNVSTYGLIEATKIFEHIYPHRDGSVTAVGDPIEFCDSGIDFDLDDYFVPGISRKVHFNTGDLAGYEYEIEIYEHTGNSLGNRYIRIVVNQDAQGYDLPSATLKPKVGDEYVILDIQMPQSYIDQAESDLEDAVDDYLAEHDDPRVRYILECDPKYVESEAIDLHIGDKVTVVDTDLNVDREIRITKISINIRNQYDIKFELADAVDSSLTNQLFTDIDNLSRININTRAESIPQSRFNFKSYTEIQTEVRENAKTPSFVLRCSMDANPGDDQTKFDASAGELIHYTVDPDVLTEWTIYVNNITSLTEGTVYYVYAHLHKTELTNANNKIELDATIRDTEDGDYYNFPVGILHAVANTNRYLSINSGISINDVLIPLIGKIKFGDGDSYITESSDDVLDVYIETVQAYTFGGTALDIHANYLTGDVVDIRQSTNKRIIYDETLHNWRIGENVGNDSMTGTYNYISGFDTGKSLTSGGNNVLIGSYAGDAIQSGTNHTMIGVGAGTSLIASSSDVYIGYYSGSNVTGINNTIIGGLAMQSAGSSQNSIAIGKYAGRNSEGNFNLNIGYRAGQGVYTETTASLNIFIGYDSGNKIRTGGENTGIGPYSLFSLQSGTNNNAIGAYAGRYALGSNNIFIGRSAGTGISTQSTGIGNVFIGYSTGDSFTTGNYSVLIGYNVDLSAGSDSYVFRLGFSTTYILEGNMTAASEWIGSAYEARFDEIVEYTGAAGVTIEGILLKDNYLDLPSELTIKEATVNFIVNDSSAYNLLIGTGAGAALSTGTYNYISGTNALNVTTAGSYCVAIGYGALENNTNDKNVAIGIYAGASSTDSTYTVFIGRDAGRYAYTGSQENIYIGDFAGRGIANPTVLSQYNIGIGSNALEDTNGSYHNVAIGAYAGRDVISGHHNLFLGAQAGNTTTIGSYNILIGYNVEASAVGADDEFRLGYDTTYILEGSMVVASEWIGSAYEARFDNIVEYTTDSGILFEGVKALDSFLEFSEIVKPANPAADKGRLYSKDDSGTTKLYFLDSGGTETDLLAIGGGNVIKVGTPVDNQVGVWTGDGTIEGNSNLTWNNSVFKIAGGNYLEISGTNEISRIFSALQWHYRYSDTATNGLLRVYYRYGGTYAVPAAAPTDAAISKEAWIIYDGNSQEDAGNVTVKVDGSVADETFDMEVKWQLRDGTTVDKDIFALGTDVITAYVKFQTTIDLASDYAGYFFNDGDNINRYGIKIQSGADDQASNINKCLSYFDGNGDEQGGLENNSGAFQLYQGSDRRLKTEIKNTEINATEILNLLRVRDFRFKGKLEVGKLHTGWIAQEVNEVFPRMSDYKKESDLWTVSPTTLIPILNKGFQEHDKEIKDLKQEVRKLRDIINNLVA